MRLFCGVFTKFILLQAGADEGFLWLSVIAVVMSFISLYYYLTVIKELYVSEPEEEGRLPVPALASGMTVALVAGVFYVGIYPAHLLEIAEEATKLLFV